MNTKRHILSGLFRVVMIGCIIQGTMFLYAPASNGQEITPTDVFYLAQSIDDTLIFRYGLSDEPFQKKRICENLRPRNVFQKALSVIEEFNVLHGNIISQAQIETARNIDASDTKPKDVFGLLSLIKNALAANGMFMEFAGERSPKVPSDVFQMLRQISWHHLEIANQKGLTTNWATPAQVYDEIVHNILPAVQTIAEETNMAYDDYAFPPQPVSGLFPRNVYKLLTHIYRNIATYYKHQESYNQLELTEMNDCDELSPADVFDLAQIVTAEIKSEIGLKPLKAMTAERYARWKEAHDNVEPGHVFRLMQYNYILTKRVLEIED